MTSPKHRRKERMYRYYMDFFDRAERNRRWHPLHDIPWDALENPRTAQDIRNGEGVAAEENIAVCLETFCGVELFIPDYTAQGLNMARDIFGQAWFHLAWGYEESKHALTFREYLLRSGLRTEERYMEFEEKVLKSVWRKPFHTYRQMACYGALQEAATLLIYVAQRDHYKKTGNQLLYRIFDLIARDEAAHTSLYRNFLQFEFEEDHEGAEEDLAFVISHFEMPGVALLPDFYQRLEVEGVAISPALFMEKGIMPILKRYDMSRRSMLRALHRRRDKLAREPLAETEQAVLV